jgi:hypothetical protein
MEIPFFKACVYGIAAIITILSSIVVDVLILAVDVRFWTVHHSLIGVILFIPIVIVVWAVSGASVYKIEMWVTDWVHK